jgi:hypothetical protein
VLTFAPCLLVSRLTKLLNKHRLAPRTQSSDDGAPLDMHHPFRRFLHAVADVTHQSAIALIDLDVFGTRCRRPVPPRDSSQEKLAWIHLPLGHLPASPNIEAFQKKRKKKPALSLSRKVSTVSTDGQMRRACQYNKYTSTGISFVSVVQRTF